MSRLGVIFWAQEEDGTFVWECPKGCPNITGKDEGPFLVMVEDHQDMHDEKGQNG